MFRFLPSPCIVHSLLDWLLLPDIDQYIYSLYCVLCFLCWDVMLSYTRFIIKLLNIKIIKMYHIMLFGSKVLLLWNVFFYFVDIDSFMLSFVFVYVPCGFHWWFVFSSCCFVGCRLVFSLWSPVLCNGVLSGTRGSLELAVNVPLLDGGPKGRNMQ
jgi:hypothetical protein